MAATITWYEQNGSATGSPAHGSQSVVTGIEWKNIDDSTTSRAAAPITAGENSYIKYNYVGFSGSFNQISNVKWAHTSGSLGSNLTLVGKVTSTYATPVKSAMAGSTDMTSTTTVDSGQTVLLSATGPNGTAAASQTTACYTQYLATQLQTSAAASAGDTGTATFTVQYFEN